MMKRAWFCAGLLLSAAALIANAQDYKGKARVFGYVFDTEGKPIQGAKVKLFSLKVEQGFEVTTDKDGKWVAAGITGGSWNIDFEKTGYMPKKISIQVQQWARNPEHKVILEKATGLAISEEVLNELTKGNQLFDEKKYEEAIAVYQDILAKFPDAYIINRNIGNCYFQMEKYDEAETYYQKVLAGDPANGEALLMIGNCYANRGQNDKALEWYGRIEFEKIKDPVVLYNVGTTYYNSSRFEEALKYYKRAVELQSDFLDVVYQLGLTHLTMGNQPEAIAMFENYLKLDPDSARASQVKEFLEYLRKK
ncbi:MAG: tetratricopeptide repeat protein [Acidobacteriota bacterium]